MSPILTNNVQRGCKATEDLLVLVFKKKLREKILLVV